MNKKSIAWAFISALLISGCGGGGSGGSGGSTGGGTSGITLNTAPTAKLAGSQPNANSLANEINSDTQDLISAASSQSTAGAIGIYNLRPADTSGSGSCAALGTGGSGTYSYTTNYTSALTAGVYFIVTYNSCTYTNGTYTYVVNGSMTFTYTRYTSATDYAVSVQYSNVSSSISDSASSLNYSYGPYNATYNYDYTNGVITTSTTLNNGGATNISGSGLSTSGNNITIISATYVYNSSSAGGVVKVVFDNWTYDSSVGHATSGSITVTGANGDYVQIVANGTSYTVTYNINGANSAFMVNFTS
ncbi:MAG: hypothetical protein GC149_15215 [Gammaproteobacteria bacterium]|nr:hypothetical protein [Gammaproteobacteria bacterium]